ncbi:MAG: N-acetyltransferase [Halanaerobiales bacterium]|nr:N-acetyltransferase [Halanaerobiales bacterium]
MNITFEKLSLEHQEEVMCIFNYYIKKSTSAYREKTVDNEHFLNFIDGSNHCEFAIKNDQNKVIGFCLLEPFMSLSTFAEAAETMYFIDHEYTGQGIGTLVLKKLEDEARKRGIKKLLANISSENANSINFHQKNGFVEYGRLKNVGKKFDRYFSIVWMGKELS